MCWYRFEYIVNALTRMTFILFLSTVNSAGLNHADSREVTLQIVYHKQYIQTVSVLNVFASVLPDIAYFQNICCILRTCIYLREYSYANTC